MGRLKGPVDADRFSVDGCGGPIDAGSATVDCDKDEGPAGSLAGTVGRARGPADWDRFSCLAFLAFVTGGLGGGSFEPVLSSWAASPAGDNLDVAALDFLDEVALFASSGVSSRCIRGLGPVSTASVVGGGVGAMPGGDGRDFLSGWVFLGASDTSGTESFLRGGRDCISTGAGVVAFGCGVL